MHRDSGNRAPLRLRLRIRGRVQGVWYREAMRIEAERLGVRGWVKNCADGSVEAVLEGGAAAVRLLETWCHDGPPAARVTELLSNAEPAGEEETFRVLR
jgi:acylphosphatase